MIHEFDGFTVNLFEDESGDWIAHFVEQPEISAFGADAEGALNELAQAWDAVKQTYVEEGRPIPVAPARKTYSGQFQVRIDRRIHRALAIEAARAGITLNALVSRKLAESVRQ